MMKINIGDKVEHDFLGKGIVKGIIKAPKMANVLFDVDPPIKYNMGTNPCAVWLVELTPIKGKPTNDKEQDDA